MNIKKVKKSLLAKRIRITSHALQSMNKRGYSKSDIISCIWSGEITKRQVFQNKLRVVIEGRDMDDSPVIIIVGNDDKDHRNLAIVTAYPPIKKKFKETI